MTHSIQPSSDPMKEDLKRLLAASAEDKPQLFLRYCRKVIKAKEEGHITIDEAGYRIAETMFIDELDEPLFDELTGLAGSLELPQQVSGINTNEGWTYLVRLVDEYAERLKND